MHWGMQDTNTNMFFLNSLLFNFIEIARKQFKNWQNNSMDILPKKKNG